MSTLPKLVRQSIIFVITLLLTVGCALAQDFDSPERVARRAEMERGAKEATARLQARLLVAEKEMRERCAENEDRSWAYRIVDSPVDLNKADELNFRRDFLRDWPNCQDIGFTP